MKEMTLRGICAVLTLLPFWAHSSEPVALACNDAKGKPWGSILVKMESMTLEVNTDFDQIVADYLRSFRAHQAEMAGKPRPTNDQVDPSKLTHVYKIENVSQQYVVAKRESLAIFGPVLNRRETITLDRYTLRVTYHAEDEPGLSQQLHCDVRKRAF